MSGLLNLVKEFFQDMPPSAAAGVNAANVAGTKVKEFTRLPPAVVTEITDLAEKILEGKLPDAIQKGLKSHRLAERILALEELYDLIAKKLIKSDAVMDAVAFVKVLDQVGPEALLLIPAFADSYRRHVAAKGAAKGFFEYIKNSKNRNLRSALFGTLKQEALVKLLGVIADTLFTAGQHSMRSSAAARDAFISSLGKLFDSGIPADLFFEILFSKGPNLIPPGAEKAVRQALQDAMKSGKLPPLLTQAEAAKIFKFADRSALQGPLGELLTLPFQIDRARQLASAKKQPVYVLLRADLDSVRTSVPRKMRPALDTLPAAASPAETRKAAEEFEIDLTAITSSRSKEEFTDGVIATFDGKGGVFAEVWTEVKVDRRGPAVGLDQFDRNREDVEFLASLKVGAIVEVTETGVRYLSSEEAIKVSGATFDAVNEVLIFAENKQLLDRLAELERQLAKGGSAAVLAEIEKLRSERRLANFKGAEKALFVGAEQKKLLDRAEIANIEIKDYGHDYETVVDAVVTMLASMGFRSLSALTPP